MDVLEGWMPRAAAGLLLALPMASSAQSVVGEAPLTVVVLDRSGSMGEGYDWLADFTLRVDRALGGDASAEHRYGLVEFLDTTHLVRFDGGALGDAADVAAALRGLRTGGGQEDGYRALHAALQRFAPMHSQAMNVLLVSNEDRDAVAGALAAQSIAAELAGADVRVDALVNVRFRCDDGREALGMRSGGAGYVAGADATELCSGVHPEETIPAGQTTVADYVELALASGGTAWNIYQAWGPERMLAPFSVAFAAAQRAGGRAWQDLRPIAPRATYEPRVPRVGDVVTLDASTTVQRGPTPALLAYDWDTDGDGSFDVSGTVVAARFTHPGSTVVTLRVSDSTAAGSAVETRIPIEVQP
jgi:von Willebrand factor type A domain